MKEKIKAYAAGIGIKETGFARYGQSAAVVCLFPYFSGYRPGNLSVYAYSTDYHIILRDKLKLICDFLIENGASRAESFADIGPAVDKDLAYHAGLGFYGRNTLMINPRLGSYFFIGYVVTDMELEPDSPIKGGCMGCGRCVKACPGGALDGGFCEERCVSAISQKKGELTDEEARLIKKAGYAFGCDICQRVCPHNQIPLSPMPEFTENQIYDIKEDMFADLSNRQFREKYGRYAFSWRGKAVLLRNIRILNKK